MNFQLSLDAGGNPIDENDGYGKADNDFARLEGPPQKTKPVSYLAISLSGSDLTYRMICKRTMSPAPNLPLPVLAVAKLAR